MRAKRALLDCMGCLIEGINTPTLDILRNYNQSFFNSYSEGKIPILGTTEFSNPLQTAFIHGCGMHILDFEPLWHPPTHPCSSVLAALISVCYLKPSTGKEFLTSFVLGLELEARLGLMRKNYDVPLIFHPPGSEGTLASALATAKLYALNTEQMIHAIGISASRASAIMANVGSMTKCTHPGNAARMGLESTLLALFDFTAGADVFNLKSGYFAAFSDIEDAKKEELFKQFSTPFWLENQEFGFKFFPCQFSTSFAIEASIRLSQRILPQDITKIVIRWPRLEYLDRPQVTQMSECKFSLQYLVASALIRQKITNEEFTPNAIHDLNTQQLMKKISLKFDDSLNPNFDSLFGEILITDKFGNVHSENCVFPVGHWHNPASNQKIIEKFVKNMENSFEYQKIKKISDECFNLEHLNNMETWLNQFLPCLK